MTDLAAEAPAQGEAVPSGDRRWTGMILPIDTDAADGRRFTGEMQVRKLPLHLRWVPNDVGEHKGAITVGSIDSVERRPDGLWAIGTMFDPEEFSGSHADAIRSATNLIRLGLGQVSADVLARKEYSGGREINTDGVLMGATLVGLPAFEEARTRLAAAALGVVHEGGQAGTAFGDDLAPARMLDAFDCTSGLCQTAQVSYAVTGAANLPIGPDRAWDGPAAARRMLDAATDDDGEIKVGEASRGFFWRDGDGSERGHYKLPFADLVSGELVVIPSALSAVLSRLDATQGPSDTDRAAIRTKAVAYQARARAARRSTETAVRVAYSVTGNTSLPTVERGSATDRAWDNGKAFDAIFAWAGAGSPDGPDVEKLSQAFLYRNPDRNPQAKWAWQIPIAMPVGGELRIVPQAVFNASTIGNGGRADVSIPAAELARIRTKIKTLYKKVGYVPPEERKNPRKVEKLSIDEMAESVEQSEAVGVESCSTCASAMDAVMSEAMAGLSARINEEMGFTDG